MRKLVFRLLPVNNGSATPNLDISTHLGARLHLEVNRAAILDAEEEPMSDSELLTWYKTRYSGLGLGISLLKDGPTIPSGPQVVVPDEEPVVDVTEEQPALEIPEEQPVQPEPAVQEDLAEPTEKATVETKVESKVLGTESKVSAVESKVLTGTAADDLSYEELLKFAEEHDIPISKGRGRSEISVRKTVSEWMKAHD